MSIVSDAVKILENRISGSGCEDGIVRITPASSAGCPYEDGITIVTEYGGRVAELSTSFPLETTSKVSFMFDSPLKSPVQRTAACAILNVISSFMCFTRKGRACGEESRKACLDELISDIAGKKSIGFQSRQLNPPPTAGRLEHLLLLIYRSTPCSVVGAPGSTPPPAAPYSIFACMAVHNLN